MKMAPGLGSMEQCPESNKGFPMNPALRSVRQLMFEQFIQLKGFLQISNTEDQEF